MRVSEAQTLPPEKTATASHLLHCQASSHSSSSTVTVTSSLLLATVIAAAGDCAGAAEMTMAHATDSLLRDDVAEADDGH